MRRILAFALSSLVVIALAACSSTRSPESTGDVGVATPSPTPTVVDASATEPQTPASQLTPAAPKPHPEGPAAPTGLNVPLRVHNPSAEAGLNEPVTSGLPLPLDMGVTDPSQLRLVDTRGSPVPAQFTPLARWGGAADDGAEPIRWVLIDMQASVPAHEETFYFLQEGGPGPQTEHPLSVTETADALVIETQSADGEPLVFSFSKEDGGLTAPGLAAPLFGRARSGGVDYVTAGPVSIEVGLAGPLRTSIQVRGAFRDAGSATLLDYTSRYWFYTGRPTVRVFHTVENNTLCPLGEYEQIACMDIGSEGSVTAEDVSLVVPAGLDGALTFQVGGEGGAARGDLTGELVHYQDSSGTDHWDHYPTLVDWDGNDLDTAPRMQSFVTFRGYRTTLDGESVDAGDQSPGWLRVSGDTGSYAVSVRDFWQNYPKSLRAVPGGEIEVGLFPAEYGPNDYTFTLRPGEHKTHEIVFSASGNLEIAEPLIAVAPTAWYVDSGAFGATALPDEGGWPEHEAYIRHQLDTAPTYEEWMDWYPNLLAAIDGTDFYGIFDYGDWPIDYEGLCVAPLNPKYDIDLGTWLQWARTGDARWFALAEAMGRHVADIDILHNLHDPRHWADGIAFGHSYHDEAGFTNPHRNEGGAHPDTAYGLKGMLLTYYLTGYEKALESALELADCVEYRLHNDWNLCDAFPDCSGEGYGLMEGMWDSGSRPAANALAIAVEAYRATADPRFLAVADAVVAWADPNAQPYIDGPTGEDRYVKPWQLNMYLRSLAGYLEMREEFGLADDLNAQGDYLAYADWLRTHAWIELEPMDAGRRAAYPYEWWFDERQGDTDDEWAVGNNVPSVNNWLLLGADAMAYAYHLSGEANYLDRAAALFRTGSHDPFFEGDANTYSATKETANGISYGHLFLHEWANR